MIASFLLLNHKYMKTGNLEVNLLSNAAARRVGLYQYAKYERNSL